jgi:diguanylate cyclase
VHTLSIEENSGSKSRIAPAPDTDKGQSLAGVLTQNKRATGLLQEAAIELSSVNKALNAELARQDPPAQIEKAIEKNEAVEEKVQRVSEKLTHVNRALEGEVRDRVMLEHRFDAISEQEESARHAAFHDPLTGLPNRLLFFDRLEHGLAQASRHGWGLAVMFIDLDGFKTINDTHGHAAGDRVLKTIASRLKQNTRSDDTVSRYGGDEFLYLLMEAGTDQDVRLIAEKISAAIKAPCDLGLQDTVIQPIVNASIGIAIFPKHGVTAEALIRGGDAAMYRAKHDGSGCVFAV